MKSQVCPEKCKTSQRWSDTYLFALVICVGNSLGAFAIGSVHRRSRLWMPVTLASIGAAMLFFASEGVVASFMAAFVFFVAQIILIGVSEVAIEAGAPPALQGRLFGINESAPILALSLGSVAAAGLGRDGLLLLGLVAAAVYGATAATAGRSEKPAVRHRRRPHIVQRVEDPLPPVEP